MVQPTTAVVLGIIVLVPSVLALVYRLTVFRRAAAEVKAKRHYLGTREGGGSFLLTVELPDGSEHEVEVWQHLYSSHEVGDSVEISYFQGPAWWGTSVDYGRGLMSSPLLLVVPLLVALGLGLLIWGLAGLA